MADIPNELAKKVLEKLMDWAVGEAQYICCFTSIARDYEKEKEKLEAKVKAVGQRVDELKRSAQDTSADVTSCQDRAGELIQDDNKIKKTCFFGWCPNCIWRYNRGKELANKMKEIAGLLEEIGNLNITGLAPHLPGVEYHSSQDYISFKSRELIYKELLDALTDDNSYIIGLHGMGGSGKTTLAIKVGQELKQSKQFDLVIVTAVSSTPDIINIQDEIAVPLGLASELKDKTEPERRGLLWKRLTNGEKILLIFDDVWENTVEYTKFEKIGIPKCNDHNKGCKVLLTTRDLSACRSLGCEKVIELRLLPEDEAWTLFEKHARMSSSTSKRLVDKGHEIVKECKGLPVAISIIASRLKGEQRQEQWNAALLSLQKRMHGVNKHLNEIYKCLWYSYDNMNNEEAKRLFLLCSLFPEDKEIPIEILTRFGIGAGLFGEVYDKYIDVRTQVAVAKNELIDSCLLLKAEKGCVKMHDLVREVALLKVNKEIRAVNLFDNHQKSLVESEKGMKYLLLEGHKRDVYSYKFDGSELEILKISYMAGGHSMPNSFFENMTKLRVLHLSSQDYWKGRLSLAQSIESLTNIRSLFLERLRLGDISILGKLQSLEALDLVLCEVIELPSEIAELKKLRLLQLDRCEIGGNNAFEVIERCSSLEELYFIYFKVYSSSIHKKVTLPALERYHIRELWLHDGAYDSMSKHVCVSDINTYFSEATFKYLLQTAEALELQGFKGEWRNFIPEIVPIDHLVKLCLKSCSKLQFLIDSRRITLEQNVSSTLAVLKLEKMENLKELCNGPLPYEFFKSLEYLFIHHCQSLGSILFMSKLNLSNLKTIKLFVCPKLVTLFQLSTCQSLVLLEELTIIDCELLGNIIADEEIVGADNDNRGKSRRSMFPNLKTLYITDCPRLEFILPVLSPRDVPVLECVIITHCAELKYIFGKYQHENEEMDLHQEVKDVILGSVDKMDLNHLPKLIDIFEECYHPKCSSMKRSSSKPQMQSEPLKCNIFPRTHKYRHKLRSSTSSEIPSFLKETEDQTIQKDSTSEETVTATLSTDSETRSTSLGPLPTPPEKSIKRRVEEGTTSVNAKTITSSTHSEPVSSLPGPLVPSEHNTYPRDDGGGQIAVASFSGVTTEPPTTKDVDLRDSQETSEFVVALTHAPVSLNEDASMKVSSISEEHISNPDNVGVSESKPSPIASKSPSVPFEETQGDDNNTPQLSTNPGYSRDASGELNPGPDAAGVVAIPSVHREPEFPPRLMARSRSQAIWTRPSERLVPRTLSSPATESPATEKRTDLSAIETQVRNLVEGLRSSDLDTQREATVELRFLAKHNVYNRIAIANCGAISILVDLLRSADTRIQENAVTALLNLSINDNNKAAIINAGAIDPLIHVLETGSPEAKENSAATLFSLSVIEENKISIGRSGAIRPLVDLLGNGTPRGKKDAATALFNLSIFHENKNRIVQAGAVKHLVELMDPTMVDKAVAILANLATIPEGRDAIAHEGGIPVLVEVLELSSARGKENAAAALVQLCSHGNRYLSMVLQQGAVPALVALSQSGTPRAKEKAQVLLNRIRSQRHGNAGKE